MTINEICLSQIEDRINAEIAFGKVLDFINQQREDIKWLVARVKELEKQESIG